MSMIISLTSNFSFNYFIIVISCRIFKSHSCIKSIHKLFIFFSAMITCTILPHHISNSSSFSNS